MPKGQDVNGDVRSRRLRDLRSVASTGQTTIAASTGQTTAAASTGHRRSTQPRLVQRKTSKLVHNHELQRELDDQLKYR